MTSGPAFSRILAVHTGQQVDRELLEYSALLASSESEASTLVAAFPGESILGSLAPAARAIFAARGAQAPAMRLFTEPELDCVFEAAVEYNADLILARRPENGRQGRAIGRRLVSEAPCSVCLVPPNVALKIDRAIAGVDLSPKGQALLASAARFCGQTGAEELIALHSCFRETLIGDDQIAESFLDRRLVDLHRLLPRAALAKLDCTPAVEQSVTHDRALLRAVCAHEADVLVVGRWGLLPASLAYPSRELENLLWHCPVPLLQVLLSKHRIPFFQALGARLFANPEPVFN
ncbi:MAG: universal stress protein [Bryobacterales bacterium]